MKQYIIILFNLFFCVSNIYSQEFDEWPSVSSQNDKEMKIKSVSINGTETVVAIYVNRSKSTSLVISHNMHLTTNTKTSYAIRKFTTGNGWLELDKKHRPSKSYTLYLYFDKIPSTTSSIDIDEPHVENGHYWKGISLKKKVSPVTSSGSSYRRSSSDLYSSSQQIRNYLSSNLNKLDAVEGEYDVEFSGEYITPLVHQYLDRENFKIWIVRENGNFKIYTNDGGGFRKSRYLKIQPIGETNVYTFYYDTTPTRIYLENLNHFRASLHLNNSSANTYRGASSTAASVNILPVYDYIKVYPTISMYSDVNRKHVEEETKPSLWTGTGFALKDNYIVTNYHVVEDAKSISIRGVNGIFTNNYNARVVASDKFNDLAILKVEGVTIPATSIPYSIKTITSEVGEDVFVLGYPLTSTMGDEIKLTTDVVSSKSGFQGDVSLYQISAPIQPGNSGGPLFDGKGNIIGIVSAKHKGTENVSYAIKASYLTQL